MWEESGTPIFVADGPNSWCILSMIDGLFQGHNLSSLLFCIGLRRGLKRFLQAYCASVCGVDGPPIHIEYIDDILMKLRADEAKIWLPLLRDALSTVGLRLNLSKCKDWIPSAPEGTHHGVLAEVGLPQVFGGLEVMGGALDGQHRANIGAASSDAPAASLKRADRAENLAATIRKMLRTPLSQPVRRAAWTLLDKVLNKALDYDARILSPESFSNLAERLDNAVRDTAVKVIDVGGLDTAEEECLRLSARKGGCDVTLAQLKQGFSHLAASSQFLPAAAELFRVWVFQGANRHFH
jgi:hypothetical protein